jgi:hypothetical protein
MGQRTAIILQHAKEDGTKETRVFYNQWGTGRITPSNVLSILYGILSVGYLSSANMKNLCPSGMLDDTDDHDQNGLNTLDFSTPEKIGKVLRDESNNNGGVFIRVTSENYGTCYKTKFAFMLGHEEGGDYKSFCTSDEWMSKAGARSCDEEFRKLFNDTLDYFGAVEVVK